MLFALVLNALLLLALLTLGVAPVVKQPELRNPVTFEMAPAPKADKKEPQARKSEKKEKVRKAESEKVPPRVKPPVPVEKPVERLVEVPSASPFLVLDSAQMASADIGKMPKKEASAGQSAGAGSATVAGPGEGPGGVQLFEAEWYRRPSHAELSSYIPANAPAKGWGLVACKTVENFHVENCQALGESPVGSGLARAVRLAAWQFLVRPPRVNGKPMVGSWVRIRIDYSQSGPSGGAGEP